MSMKGTQFLERDIHVSAFEGPGRILWVMSTASKAANFWEFVLFKNPAIRMGFPGIGFLGEGFDRIILDDVYAQLENMPKGKADIKRAAIDHWIQEGLRPRLTKDGTLEMLVEVKS